MVLYCDEAVTCAVNFDSVDDICFSYVLNSFFVYIYCSAFLIFWCNSILQKVWILFFTMKVNILRYLWHYLIEYWTLKQKQQAPRLTWEIKGQYKAYNPTLKKCNLCLNEKLAIIDDPDLLNKRSEVISQCRHRNKFKLVSLTSHKTPNDVI